MSGRKRTYVSVADDELARLRQAEQRLSEVRRDLPTVVEGVRKQVRKDFDRRLATVDERQRRFDARVAGLSDEVRSVERDAQRRLAEQNVRLRTELDRGLGTVRAEVAARLDAQSRAVDAALAAESAARRRDVAALSDQVGNLEATVRSDREQAEAVARRWLEGAETLRAFIDAELAHQRFAPGRLAALTRAARRCPGQRPRRDVAGGRGGGAVGGPRPERAAVDPGAAAERASWPSTARSTSS